MVEEQHLVTSLDQVKPDHIARYRYAAKTVSGKIFDGACGCGYGSFIMAEQNARNIVMGVDLSKEAIDWADAHWKLPNNSFSCQDIFNVGFEHFDWLISFETIEHVDNPELFLKKASEFCKNIICSVPNQNIIPFDAKRHIFHKRHYTPNQFRELVSDCGFTVDTLVYQTNHQSTGFNNDSGRSIVIQGRSKEF